MSESLSLFILMIGCIFFEGAFTMLELATVSFNKVRLQYYVSQKSKRAEWISYLLNHPTRLFGTTLITANLALLLGSEASRRFYESLGITPDIAPLTQVILVVVCAEIAPLFAARKHPEHVAMLGVPLLYLFSMLLKPVIKILEGINRLVNALFGLQREQSMFLSREELQKILEEHEEGGNIEEENFNTVVANIFDLKRKTAQDLMQSLSKIQLVPSNFSVKQLRNLLKVQFSPFVPVFQRNNQNIIGIAYPRDLIKVDGEKHIKEYIRSAWFITENQSILEILKQFRLNNQSLAIVLNKSGLAVGVITLDAIIDEIFDRSDEWMSYGDILPKAHQVLVEKVFDADMLIEDFNKAFGANLHFPNARTLEDILTLYLGHIPTSGETIRVDQYELSVVESSLRGPKTVLVKTLAV